MPRYQIVTIGSAVQDIMFRTDQAETLKNPKPDPTKLNLLAVENGAKIRSDDVRLMFGGGAANTAITCARLGLKTATVLRMGCDGVGDLISQHLHHEKIDTTYIQHDGEHATGFSFVLVEASSNEHVAFAHYGANSYLDITPSLIRQIKTDWFYVSSLSMKQWPKTMATVQRAAAKVAWNPGAAQLAAPVIVLKKLLPHTMVLILNRDEATELTLRLKLLPRADRNYTGQHLARALGGLGIPTVVVTDGAEGAYAFADNKIYFDRPRRSAKPKDTTGAGDSFGSTFIAGLIKRPHDIRFALRLATINATAQVAVVGAQQGLLTWSQLMKRYKK